ncbi:DNA internalization-related competence protein ComEC/Rec2 [Pseudomonas sp. CCC3.1]|uniref:DNA internalization-related competence protein ComEC/Rec2 n=1 Tax=Pseudomonas sp. CCC3.1 TaxID=3048607 RepID=UPI002AC8D508|nr:DNA internalization-related competence protein ComEC/Rec2 [Pseudomonas sp. CCC3.1]MEB0206400.1 DNA internalization-related competence protein ComEC/Rec2 [Pseudomonas sp. CCC3.1]WPX37430.1 DNA internalization-related competence protein ComEC/Rec2 [Pseudomonas sp. CCC3.1]
MHTRMLALASGLIALRYLPVIPAVEWVLLLLGAGLLLLGLRMYPPGLFLLGLGWACVSGQWALDDRLAPALDGRTLWVEGRVVGLPQRSDVSVRFELQGAQSRHAELPSTLRLSWYGGPPVNSGERWRLAVNLKRPKGLLNPQGFDFQAWLLAQRVGATGTIKEGQLLAPARHAWRDGLRQQLLRSDANGRAPWLAALVMGDGSGLSREDWTLLQATGTVHLLVISGQHIGLFFGLIYGLIALLARYGLWPRRLPWLPWACGLAFAGALGYGLLAGFEVPVQRACVMLGLVLIWRLRFRHLGAWLPFLLALNAVLIAEPLASLMPGFWLSFAAVAVLILTFGSRLGPWGWKAVWLRPQGLIAVGLFPMLWILGLPISLSGPLANLLAVPWISLAVLPTALLGTLLLPVPWLGDGLLWVAGGLLNGLIHGLMLLADTVSPWSPATVPLGIWLLCAAGAVILLLPAGMVLRPLGWPLVLLAVFAAREQIPHGQVEVLQLDVGQGLAMVLRTRHHTLLYDAGPKVRDFDQGERVVVPALRSMGIGTLDMMLLSHADSDHAGGALAVQRAMKVMRVVSGDVPGLPESLKAQPCTSEDSWEWDGVRFSLWQWPGATDGNQKSCVLHVEASDERLLLTGDIDIQAERAFMASPLAVPTQWLQAPHHGSRTSSSAVFLKKLSPAAVLISRGHGNTFGHPHPQVMARYKALGMTILDSAEQGAIRFRLGAFGVAESQRDQRRFWRD